MTLSSNHMSHIGSLATQWSNSLEMAISILRTSRLVESIKQIIQGCVPHAKNSQILKTQEISDVIVQLV